MSRFFLTLRIFYLCVKSCTLDASSIRSCASRNVFLTDITQESAESWYDRFRLYTCWCNEIVCNPVIAAHNRGKAQLLLLVPPQVQLGSEMCGVLFSHSLSAQTDSVLSRRPRSGIPHAAVNGCINENNEKNRQWYFAAGFFKECPDQIYLIYTAFCVLICESDSRRIK